ncbi:MAG: hypothetical protein ACRD0W_23285 [Acidimicrobiales bacterium]
MGTSTRANLHDDSGIPDETSTEFPEREPLADPVQPIEPTAKI